MHLAGVCRCPSFVPMASALFQLRLHHYLFSVVKSVKSISAPGAVLRVLYPNFAENAPQTVASIDFNALAVFCQIQRTPQLDVRKTEELPSLGRDFASPRRSFQKTPDASLLSVLLVFSADPS